MLPRFWRKIKYRYNLIGSKCKNCETLYYPPRNICPKCRRRGEMEELELWDEGRVISYTIVHETSDDFKLNVPYIIALIKLENGVIITSQVVCNPSEIKIGMKVKPVFRKYGEDGEDGVIYYGTKFVPAD